MRGKAPHILPCPPRSGGQKWGFWRAAPSKPPLFRQALRTYAVVHAPTIFAFGRVVLFLFLVPNFRRGRKLGTKSESLPRGRRRKRRGVETTVYVLTYTNCALESRL